MDEDDRLNRKRMKQYETYQYVRHKYPLKLYNNFLYISSDDSKMNCPNQNNIQSLNQGCAGIDEQTVELHTMLLSTKE